MCMDAAAAAEARSEGLGALPAEREHEQEPEQLSDNYSLGEELGRGEFGIVYACTSKDSSEEYAVKRVDRRKSTIRTINREVGMLRKLAHPCVVNLHDVYSDADTVDMVFNIYRGGDMVGGMLTHWDSKGDIPMAAVQNLTSQVFRGIEWLHRNNVVHRDIKAENYLMDRANLAHPDCRICLSDFGLAVELESEGRLEDHCGTECYWAPEFYSQSYGHKVDVWAAGVIMYGLIWGSFPFRSEDEVNNKRIEVSWRCDEAGRSFLLAALARCEADRLSAQEALRHPFLAPSGVPPQSPDACFKAQARKACGLGGGRVEARLSSSSHASEATTAASSSGSGSGCYERTRDARADPRFRCGGLSKSGISCLGGVARLLSVTL